MIISIVATALLFVFYLVETIMSSVMSNNPFATWVIFYCVLGCIGVLVYTLVLGIKGIKDRNIRGKSIATVVISSIGLSSSLGITIYYIPYLFQQ